MKPFAKRLLAFAGAAAITLSSVPAVSAANPDVSPITPEEQWAAVEVASMEVLIPEMVRSTHVAAPLSRQGLCSLLMNSYKSLTGLTDEDLGAPDVVFTDTTDTDVLNAYHLDLINGRSSGIFAPDAVVSRQDFYTIAVNLLKAVGYPYIDHIDMDLSAYADGDSIIAYAKQPVRVLLCLEAITAEEGAALNPAGVVTAEEAVAVLDRLVTFYSAWVEDPVEPQRYLGEEIAEFALKKLGCRYVSGGKGPRKFDCSGLVYYVYKNFGYTLKPGARNQWKTLDQSVKKKDLLPGDLLFFSNNGKASGIFHVGIYIGDGQFIHAANPRKGVVINGINDAWYAKRYLGAKRAID